MSLVSLSPSGGFRRVVVLAALLAGVAAAPAVRADQLIHIPTADRVPGLAAEYKHRTGGREGSYGTLMAPVGTSFELMFRYYAGRSPEGPEFERDRYEAGGMFQLLPDGIITPGIAVGLWDITNTSPWGRRAFLILTKSFEPLPLGVPRPFERLHASLGTGTGRFSGLLAGARAELPGRISLVGEFDARSLNGGIWYQPLTPLTFKAEIQRGRPFFGLDLRTTF
jgi:hypothetical protein